MFTRGAWAWCPSTLLLDLQCGHTHFSTTHAIIRPRYRCPSLCSSPCTWKYKTRHRVPNPCVQRFSFRSLFRPLLTSACRLRENQIKLRGLVLSFNHVISTAYIPLFCSGTRSEYQVMCIPPKPPFKERLWQEPWAPGYGRVGGSQKHL